MTDNSDKELLERLPQIMADYNKAEQIFTQLSAQLNGLESNIVLWHTAKILQSIMTYSFDGKWDDFLVLLKLAVESHEKIHKGEVPNLPKAMKEMLN